MAKEPHEMTASELSALFASRDISPVEVTEACLTRIEGLDAGINAFCHMDPETSRAQAEASEARWLAGEPLSPLDGVPVAVKDLLVTKGWPTRRGSYTVDPNAYIDTDAPTVARLREAGAVLIGKTTTPEFGWKGSTDSPLTGITRNPWNKTKTPGGSSGGSSAGLAARFCPLALGTDGGGSIRIPASFTNTYGLKPSFGRVPAYPLSPFGTLAHVGPMSRTVLDSAMLMNVIAKPDARDWYSLPYEPTDYAAGIERPLAGKRIAFSPRMGFAQRVLPEIDTLAAAAAKRFEQLGAHVEQVDPPGGDPGATFRTLWWSGAAAALGDLPEEQKAKLDPGLRRMTEEGMAISKKDYLSAMLARGAYGSAMRQFMEKYDFLLTPQLATTAFDVGQLSPLDDDGRAWMAWTPFTVPFNLTQQPAASVPCGFSSDGLPVGLQIVGKMFDDAGVLAASFAYEMADPHFDKTPKGF
ncbi:MAG: amidase [Alphaproteobacteria bacterium]|nr:amidase [Alphaproteobacteria bacterium]MBL6939250.1 amidase [Alphaproteobacteria bacterium]MBL7096766.1 amidase [Alphaproteobacteria bacterium]